MSSKNFQNFRAETIIRLNYRKGLPYKGILYPIVGKENMLIPPYSTW